MFFKVSELLSTWYFFIRLKWELKYSSKFIKKKNSLRQDLLQWLINTIQLENWKIPFILNLKSFFSDKFIWKKYLRFNIKGIFRFLSCIVLINNCRWSCLNQISKLKKNVLLNLFQRIFNWKNFTELNFGKIFNFSTKVWDTYQNLWKLYNNPIYITLGLKTPKNMFLTKFYKIGNFWTFLFKKNFLQQKNGWFDQFGRPIGQCGWS